jgi:pyridoxal phosphate enzyme (YggS family)
MQTIPMNIVENFRHLRGRVETAAQRAGHPARLLAVSKTQPAAAVAALAALGQTAFGENYVQEALAKRVELAGMLDRPDRLEWHAIGPLQSNKARDVARNFDWLHSLDRLKLIEPLARHRPSASAPLQVLIQVNIDDETSKSGCTPGEIAALAEAIAAAPALTLRGLMTIPAPADLDRRRAAFARMRELFAKLHADHPQVDTLSTGMSDDFELAIAEGATLVRIGTALFGARKH